MLEGTHSIAGYVEPARAAARTRGDAARIEALDGLRGLAILSVLLFHGAYLAEPKGMSELLFARTVRLGWVGVDLFFVLSGFLITSVLLATRQGPHYFGSFFARRALRIFPVYYLFLVLVLWVLPALAPGAPELRTLQENQGYFWSYTTNLLIAAEGAFTGAPANMSHLWSLAVEEQFYLLWPLIVWRLSPRALARACLVLLFASAGTRLVVHALGADTPQRIALYVSTPTRLDGLMVGALVACHHAPRGLPGLARWLKPLGLMGACAALASHVVAGQKSSALSVPMQTVGYLGLALFFGFVLVTVLAGGASRSMRALEQPALRFFGRYSYGLYLFHYPLAFVLSKSGLSPERLSELLHGRVLGHGLYCLCVLGLSTVIAVLSYRFVEMPFLRLKARFPSAVVR